MTSTVTMPKTKTKPNMTIKNNYDQDNGNVDDDVF